MSNKGRRPASRDAARTRALLLDEGFSEIYLRGFQAASIDRILERVGVTKGAFFHHFPRKVDLGYAIVDEVIRSMIEQQWVLPLKDAPGPLIAIAESFDLGARELERAPVNLGCPLNNLAQEMSPIDDGFRERTNAIFALWMGCFENAIRRSQKGGIVRAGISPRDAAFSLVSQIEGVLSLSKNGDSRNALRTGSRTLRHYLESLRAADR